MAQKPTYTVGQPVIVTVYLGRTRDDRRGEIVKVGRTLATIRFGTDQFSTEAQFRMDTQRRNDSYGNTSFRTLEEYEQDKRASAARAVLREHEVIVPGRMPLATLEALAAVLESASTAGGTGTE